MNGFAYRSQVLPGQRINMLAGVSAANDAVFNRVLHQGFRDPVDKALAHAEPDACFFGPFPQLVPCETWTELAQAVYAGFTVDGRPSSFAGAAALQVHSPQADAIRQAIAGRLGVRTEDANDQADRSFILARVPRVVEQGVISLSASEHASLWNSVLADCRNGVDQLQTRLQPTGVNTASPEAVQTVLNAVENELGSHLVESVSIGDEVLQLFVYTREQYRLICASMDKSGWEGTQALNFRYFTSPNFLLYATTPVLASNDTSFADVLPLLEDKHYGLKASIFNLVLNNQAQQKAMAISSLTCVAAHCVSVTTGSVQAMRLAETSAFAAAPVAAAVLTPARAPAAGLAQAMPAPALIDTVTIQGALARFGTDGCGPAAVSGDLSTPYATLYSPFSASAPPSQFWSPYVSLTQPYVDLGTVWNSVSVDKSAVRNLIVTADVIELQGAIDLSTLNTVMLVCRLLIAGKDGSVPSVKLSASAWDPLQLYCGTMSGTCAFEAAGNPASRRVVYDVSAVSVKPDAAEVAFDNFFGGRYPAQPLCDPATTPDAQWRKTTLQAGLETLLLSSSAALRPQALLSPALKQTAIEAWQSLQWITGYLREIVDSFTRAGQPVPEEIATLYSEATALTRVALDPRTEAAHVLPQVPSLRYTAYQDAVERLLDVATTYSEEIAAANQAMVSYSLDLQSQFREEERDQSIRKMAQFMVDQNEAFAQHEDDLVTCHNDIINKNNETILVLTQREGQIRSQYADYEKKLDSASKELADAIETKMREQEAKLVIDFAFSLVEIFGGVMTGVYGFKVAGEAKGAEATLKKWEAFLKLAEETNKLIEAGEKLAENISSVIELSDSTPNSFTAPPTDADWEIFMNDSEAQVRPAEEFVKPEVENYIAAVRNLTVVAEALNEVLAQKAQLQFNNFAEESARKVSQQQADRLRTLQLNLDNPTARPTVDYVADLGQFAAMLQQKQNNVLNQLAEIAMLQNDSMTYYYLSKPSLITKFDLASIEENLAAQALNAVQMLETYPYPPTDVEQPVEVTVECVSVGQLMSDTGVTINIAPTQGLFNSMARVRINSVDVRVEGVTTDKGQCHVQMISAGAPMTDRGLKREPLTFQMISREWHVVYDIASGKTIIGTQPGKEWDAYFTKPTPFQTWRVMLPRTPENAGMRFAGATTTVTLKFAVEMMYSTPPAAQVRQGAGPGMLGAVGTLPDPTPFLSLLKGASVADGWDVVSFLAVDRINDLWNQRWLAETDAAFQGDRQFVQQIDLPYSQSLPGNVRVDYHLVSKAGPPSLTFVADDQQAALVGIPLIDGSLTTTTFVNGQQVGQQTVVIQSTAEKPVLVKTKAALKALPGDVDNFHAVHINPADGVFAFENIELDPQVDAGFCAMISEYFKNQHLPPWLVGSLRFQADQPYLNPKTFNFRTYTPPATHQHDWPSVLGVYVLTITPQAPAHGMRQSWPDAAWPVSSDYDAAVYFSADLLWNYEVIPAMHVLSDATVQVDPYTHEYSAKFSGSELVCDQPVELREGWESNGGRPVYPHAKVTFPYSALSLKLSLSALDLACNTSWPESFPYQGRTPCCAAGDCDVSLDVAWDKVTVSCSFASQSKPHIDPNTFDVTFDQLTVSPNVNIDYDIHKFMGIPIISQIQPGIVNNAKAALTQKFSGLKIDLGTMAMFAVSNLLFPESKALDPAGVYFPGDMVIVGNVTRTWTPA